MMDQILECCEGAMGIADDVIHGRDEDGHNQNLHRFIHVAHVHGLVFNGEKCEVKQDSTTFSHSLAQSTMLMELAQTS